VVSTFGLIAVSFGLLSVLFGVDVIPSSGGLGSGGATGELAASVDGELRYYGAWYVLAGVLTLRALPRIESETFTIRLVCAALLLGATGRVLSIVVTGLPHPVFLVLLGLEVLFPVAVVPWQAALVRRST
jgi:hypothetical protein